MEVVYFAAHTLTAEAHVFSESLPCIGGKRPTISFIIKKFGKKTESPISCHFQNTVNCTALMVSRLCSSKRLSINNSCTCMRSEIKSNVSFGTGTSKRDIANTFSDAKSDPRFAAEKKCMGCKES